jgi:hypothetical protein
MGRPHLCSYCGVRDATERDHVPPKCLFAKPLPANLPTVRICSECHRPTKADDEYFRTFLAMRDDVADHPDVARGVLGAALRSVARDRQRGLMHPLLRSMIDVPVRTPASAPTGQTVGGYQPNTLRFFRTPERVVRGLFARHTGAALGPDYGVRLFADDFIDWDRMPPEHVTVIQQMARGLGALPVHPVGHVLRYQFAVPSPGEPRVSAWLLNFYGRLTFLAITGALVEVAPA